MDGVAMETKWRTSINRVILNLRRGIYACGIIDSYDNDTFFHAYGIIDSMHMV